jgi:uncharacterized protein (TIGR02266 family)
MDLYMPEMDGDEACRRIKAHPEIAAIPVIMVTQGGRASDLERCHAAGCDDVVLKPINRSQFLEVSRRHLDLIDRETPRYPARLEIGYGSPPEVELKDFSVNISTGGLFLETSHGLGIGTPLTLCINLPDRERPLRCSARVAWVNPSETPLKPNLPAGVGLQFINLSLEELHLLRDFLHREAGIT